MTNQSKLWMAFVACFVVAFALELADMRDPLGVFALVGSGAFAVCVIVAMAASHQARRPW